MQTFKKIQKITYIIKKVKKQKIKMITKQVGLKDAQSKSTSSTNHNSFKRKCLRCTGTPFKNESKSKFCQFSCQRDHNCITIANLQNQNKEFLEQMNENIINALETFTSIDDLEQIEKNPEEQQHNFFYLIQTFNPEELKKYLASSIDTNHSQTGREKRKFNLKQFKEKAIKHREKQKHTFQITNL